MVNLPQVVNPVLSAKTRVETIRPPQWFAPLHRQPPAASSCEYSAYRPGWSPICSGDDDCDGRADEDLGEIICDGTWA